MEVTFTNGDRTRHAHTAVEIVRLRAQGWTQQAPSVDAPPRSGIGSGREQWAHFAELYEVPVSDDMTRDQIINACEGAELLTGAEPAAPDSPAMDDPPTE